MTRLALLLCLTVSAPALALPVDLLEQGLEEPQSRGSYQAQRDRIQMIEGAPGHMNVILMPGPRTRDAVITGRVKLGTKPYVTIIARAHTDDDPGGDLEGLSGVGLTLDRRGMRWDRWDAGVTLPVAPRTRIKGLVGRTVDVELTLAGTSLRAVVRATDGTRLGTLAVRDRGSGTGKVAIRFGLDTESVVQALTIEAEALEAGQGPRSNPDAPLGNQRFVLVTPEQLADLPTAVRTGDLGVWPYDDRGVHGILTDPSTLWRLQDQGVALTEVRPLVPLWAVDADVRRAAREVPVGPEGPDLSRSYKDPVMVEAVLRDWAQRYPQIAHLRELGKSHRGRPIWALRISDDGHEGEPPVLITGATHGSELLSTEYALDAAQALLRGYGEDPAVTRRVDGLDIWVLPLVNPDGNQVVHQITRFGGRKNGADTLPNGRADPWEGVDLNRNYPFGWGRDEVASRGWWGSAYYRGRAPAAEPEVRAVSQLAEDTHFVASVSFHTNGSMILVPYTLNGVESPEPNTAWSVAESVAAAVPQQPNGKALRVRRQLYPVDGTDQDWLRHRFGTAAYIVEGSHHNPTSRSVRHASVAALRPLVPALLDRVLDGPTLSGHVGDPDGNPVQALISTDAETWHAGEQWRSRRSDGRFDRLLPTTGRITITASAPGFAPSTVTVDASAQRSVDLVLTPLAP